MLNTEQAFFGLEQRMLIFFNVLDHLAVNFFEAMREDDFAEIVQERAGVNEVAIVAEFFRDQLPRDGRSNRVLPKFAFVDAVAFLRGGKKLGAADGGDELVRAIEA